MAVSTTHSILKPVGSAVRGVPWRQVPFTLLKPVGSAVWGGGGGDPLAACTTHSVGSTGTTNDLWFNLSTVLGTGYVQDMQLAQISKKCSTCTGYAQLAHVQDMLS